MSKKIMPLADIYQSINVSTLESLGYENVEAEDFNLSAIKNVKIDEENSTMVTLKIKHPIFTLLDWNTHRTDSILTGLSEIIDPEVKKKSDKQKFVEKMKRGLHIVCKSLCVKESHKGEITNQMRLALKMGQYEGTRIIFTKQEIDVIQEWSPLSAKMILYNKLLTKYNDQQMFEDSEEWHDSHWKEIEKLGASIIEDLWKLNQKIINNGYEIKDVGGHKLEIVEAKEKHE